MQVRFVVLLGLVQTTLANITSTRKDTSTASDVKLANLTKVEANATQLAVKDEIDLTKVKTRRKSKKYRSTSSSSGEKAARSSSSNSGSLGISSSAGSDSKSKEARDRFIKTLVGKGWRKWHRQCAACPSDMVKKWRDPSIKWICGGYQRARRSFKSECMMHYRNCQDGTMFVKIHSQRCSDTQPGNYSRGKHFFYDYKVRLSDDSSSDSDPSESSASKASSSSSEE